MVDGRSGRDRMGGEGMGERGDVTNEICGRGWMGWDEMG